MADETTTETTETTVSETTGEVGAADLQAKLDEAIANSRKWEKAAKQTRDKRVQELETELQSFREANQSETEKAIAAARKEAADEVRAQLAAELADERVSNAIRAAAKDFTDPDDAVLRLKSEIDVGDDGRPDPKSVEAAVKALAKEKPYLLAAHVNVGSGDGGSRTPTASTDVQPGQERLMAAFAAKGK